MCRILLLSLFLTTSIFAKNQAVSDTSNSFRMLVPTEVFNCTPASKSVTCATEQPGVSLEITLSDVSPSASMKLVMLNQGDLYRNDPKQYVQFRAIKNKRYSSIDGVQLSGQTFHYFNWGNVTQPVSIEMVSGLKNGKLMQAKLKCEATSCDISYVGALRELIQSLQIAPFTKKLRSGSWQRPSQDLTGNAAIRKLMRNFE